MRKVSIAFMLSILAASSALFAADPPVRDLYSDTWVGTDALLAADPPVRDLYSDTWVATDALGRSMPTAKQVGPIKKDQRRIVSIFYVTWHSDGRHDSSKSSYTADVSRVLSEDPKARLDGNHPLWTDGTNHWGEPETGYFLSKDEYIIRKDMSMLCDAGVDVIVMDVTNAVHYWDEWDTIFTVMQKMKAEGIKVPQFCFWAYNGPCISVVQELYDKVYKLNRFKDLWFYWDGKPLLLYNANPLSTGAQNSNPHYDPKAATDKNNPHYGDPDFTSEYYRDYTKEVKSTFTLRNMWWGYQVSDGKRYIGSEDNWSFGYDLHDPNIIKDPNEWVSTHRGKKEEAAVTPAQHAATLVGKSWTMEHGEPKLDEYDLPVPTYVPWLKKTVKNPEAYGIYFQQRWDEALAANPQMIYINDWNEWIAGKFPSDDGKASIDFMRRKNNFFFVDQYNAEFNRTVEPMKGGYTDNYYMQMAQNIRKYKGARPVPVLHGLSRVTIDGQFSDWASNSTEYRDTINDTIHRDYDGYGNLHYTNTSGRNDIVTCKVAVGSADVCFYAQTNKPLTPSTGNNWMLLLIDADQNPKTGWYGYDYLINKSVLNAKQTTIMKYKAGKWVTIGKLNYRYAGNKLEVAVPRKLLGLTGKSLSFDFHWADNPADLKDPISLCVNGDSAPNRRFNYRCIWQK